MAARSPMVVIHQAHAGIRRSALRRQLQSVASGNSTSLSVDLDQSGVPDREPQRTGIRW